jgi:hypothetical protein
MPNCPVCGNNVPAGTQYCPACGTNLQQSYGAPAAPSPTPAPTYSPNYSYPQGGMGKPDTSKPPSKRRYILAIAGALCIGLVIGFFIGAFLPPSADFTTLNGTVSLSSQYHGSPNLIMFNSTIFGNLTTAVISNNYLINLPIGDTYAVSIQWFNTTGTYRCGNPSPDSFTSNDSNATQDFSC